MAKNNYFDLYPTAIYRRPSFFVDVFSLTLSSVASAFMLGETVSTSAMKGQYIGLDESGNMVIKLLSGNVKANLILTGEKSGSVSNVLAATQILPTSDTYSVNLTSLLVRFNIAEKIRNVSTLFYPYLWRDTDRVDTLADAYYGDPSYHWILMNSINARDLYYDVPLANNKLNEYLVAKYKALIMDAYPLIDWSTLGQDQKVELTYEYLGKQIGERSFSLDGKKYVCDVSSYNYYTYPRIIKVARGTLTGAFQIGERVMTSDFMATSLLPGKIVSIASNVLQNLLDGEISTAPDVAGVQSGSIVSVEEGAFEGTYIGVDYDGGLLFAQEQGDIIQGVLLTGEQSLATLETTLDSVITQVKTYIDAQLEAASLNPPVELPQATTATKSLLQLEFEKNEAKREVSVIDNDYTATIVRNFKTEMTKIRSQKQTLGDI